ncbi:MAG: MFS transporter [Actinomycetota bacterium]
MSERHRSREEEPLLRIAARRAVRKARKEAATPEFGRFLTFQATGAAGDALLALALAGSLFFSVPEATARGRIAVYLAVTVAPLAVVAPFLSRFLDRHHGGLRLAMVAAALGRGSLAWLLATRTDSLYLFPIAFAVLVLSRSALVVKGAMLPELAPNDRPLVKANSSIAKVNALAGIVAVAVGLLLLQFVSTRAELLFAATIYFLGVLPALMLPRRRGRRAATERLEAQLFARSVSIRQATFAAGGMRLLGGFLVLHLAFALRREDLGSLGLGLLVGAAAGGSLGGSLLAPVLKRKLREEGMIALALVLAGVVAVIVGRNFSVVSAAILVAVFGLAYGSAKVAFDSIVQRETPLAARGWAFARLESVLQLAWVLGALVPLGPPIPSGTGAVVAGVIANLIALVYVLGRRRVADQGGGQFRPEH